VVFAWLAGNFDAGDALGAARERLHGDADTAVFAFARAASGSRGSVPVKRERWFAHTGFLRRV
jgi:hypothetical protein